MNIIKTFRESVQLYRKTHLTRLCPIMDFGRNDFPKNERKSAKNDFGKMNVRKMGSEKRSSEF